MKKIQGIIVCLLAWAVSACTEDKGNYNYTRLNDLMIGGIEKVYTVEQSDRLAIPVEIKGTENFDSTRYDYVWYAWRINNSANPDTLSFEKNLNIEVKIAVGEYNLRYVVTDRETGIYYTTETDLNVINSYSKGIMALSSVNGNANVTFINALNRVTENAYEAINGKVAGTHPVGILYRSRRGYYGYSHYSNAGRFESSGPFGFFCHDGFFRILLHYSRKSNYAMFM